MKDYMLSARGAMLFLLIYCNSAFPLADVVTEKINIDEDILDKKPVSGGAGISFPKENGTSNIKWVDETKTYKIWEKKISKSDYGNGNSIELNKEFIKISSKKGRGFAWIDSPKIKGPGKYKFEALIKYKNVDSKGEYPDDSGKFQIVLVRKNGKDYDWPEEINFEGTSDWHNASLDFYLRKDQTAVFRTGLQKSEGTVYIKNIRIYRQKNNL